MLLKLLPGDQSRINGRVGRGWERRSVLDNVVCFFSYLFIIGQHFEGKGTTVFMLGRVGLKHSGAGLVQKLELRHCPLNIRTYPTGICWAWCRIHCFQAIRIHCYSFSLGFCYHFCSFQRVRVGEVHRFPFSIQVGEKCSVGKKRVNIYSHVQMECEWCCVTCQEFSLWQNLS